MLRAFIGTVGLMVLLSAVLAWMLMRSRRALEDRNAGETTVPVDGRSPGSPVGHRLTWAHDRHVPQVRPNLEALSAQRQRKEAEAALFRVCKSASTAGQRGPDAAHAVDTKGAA